MMFLKLNQESSGCTKCVNDLATILQPLPWQIITDARTERTDYSKLFQLLIRWREYTSVSDTRLRLAELLLTKNLHQIVQKCLLKSNQTADDLVPLEMIDLVSLEMIKQEMRKAHSTGRPTALYFGCCIYFLYG